MKLTTIILPVLASAVVLVVGCGPEKDQTSKNSSGSNEAPTTASTASVISTTLPPVTAVATNIVRQWPVRINAGAAAIKDSSGNQWLEEQGFEGGDVVERSELTVTNTPEIYRSEHYAMNSFSYKLPNGKYQVKLHFCETYEGITGPGERVFSFTVEDQNFKDFDVFAKAGGWGRAYVETVNADVADGQLDIKFTAQVENPQINGIEISPAK